LIKYEHSLQIQISMKKILPWISCLLFPFMVLGQQGPKPSDFHGVMTVDENKTIEYTSLNNPTDGINIAFYTQKPTKDQYLKKEGRRLLSFSQVAKIEINHLDEPEAAVLRAISGNETLQQASLTLKTPDKTIPEVVYLDFKWFEWSSTIMPGFPDTYRMEVRVVEEIDIDQNQ